MTNKDLSCAWAWDCLFIGTRNNVAQCCAQGYGWDAPNWLEISNLNEWYSTFEPFEKVRQEHRDGIQNDVCKRCWKYENANAESPRTRRNESITSRYPGNFPMFEHKVVKNIEIRFSNKCNLRCRMCDPNSSSVIQNLSQEFKDKGWRNKTAEHNTTVCDFKDSEKLFNLILECRTIQYIELAGGEPFLMPEVEWLLDNLIKLRRTNLNIKFITNMTSLKPRVLEQLKQFRKVNLDISMDGIGNDLEYQRYPLKWNHLERNLMRLKKEANGTNIEIGFVPCISQLNILGFADTINYIGEHFPNARIGFNIVATPSHMDYRLVPLQYRKYLFRKAKSVNLDWMMGSQRKVYKNFFKNMIKEERQITENERQALKDAVVFWDYKSDLKYRDQYPWASELLDRNDLS